jgi:hypothetical protein
MTARTARTAAASVSAAAAACDRAGLDLCADRGGTVRIDTSHRSAC